MSLFLSVSNKKNSIPLAKYGVQSCGSLCFVNKFPMPITKLKARTRPSLTQEVWEGHLEHLTSGVALDREKDPLWILQTRRRGVPQVGRELVYKTRRKDSRKANGRTPRPTILLIFVVMLKLGREERASGRSGPGTSLKLEDWGYVTKTQSRIFFLFSFLIFSTEFLA